MPRKKADKETEAAVKETAIETTDTVSDEIDPIFEENDTDINENIEPDCEEKSVVFITLKNGGSYHFRDWKFVKNEPVPVDFKIADKLMKTGFFEISGA